MNFIVCWKPEGLHVMQYRRDVAGFHFLPDFLSMFALSAISVPFTDFTEFFSVGPRA